MPYGTLYQKASVSMLVQNYWGSGLCPSSGIIKTRKHNILETGSDSILRRREEDTYSVWLALSKGPNRVGLRYSFQNVVFFRFYNSGQWTKSRTPVILNVLNHCHNSLDSKYVGYSTAFLKL
jgi:hypothetical protein